MSLYAVQLGMLVFMIVAGILSFYAIGCAGRDCVAHLKTIWKDTHEETTKEAE